MKSFILALAALALLAAPAFAADRDPAPVVADDGRHYVGEFIDFLAPETVCENGVCRVVGSTAAPAVANAAANAPAFAFRQPIRSLLQQVRTWYPGKLFQAFRANRAAARGCN